MQTRKRRIAAVSALVVLMLGTSMGVANAANYQDVKGCSRSQVGVVGLTHRGTATLMAPGGSMRRSFNNGGRMAWSEDWANRSGGGRWSVTVFTQHHQPYAYCEYGNP